MMDLGNRFRLLVNEVDVVPPNTDAETAGRPRHVEMPSGFQNACACWIYAGGAHHTGFSYAVTTGNVKTSREIAGLELVIIDANTKVRQFKQELMWNDCAYGIKSGWVS